MALDSSLPVNSIEENVYSDDILIRKQSIYNNIEPDKLYPLSDEEKVCIYPMLKDLLEES